MSESKHTPGPWEVRTLDCSLGSIDSVHGGIQVAQAQEVSVHDRNAGHRERIANARLIASAPEMLEALESLISAAMFGDEDEMDAMIRAAHEVVAKAMAT